MKKIKASALVLLLGAFCTLFIISCTDANTREKAMKIEDKELADGNNLIFSDAEIDVYAESKDGTIIRFSAKNKKGEQVNNTIKEDVIAKKKPGDLNKVIVSGNLYCMCTDTNSRGDCTHWACGEKTTL